LATLQPADPIAASDLRAHLEQAEYEYCRNLLLQYVQSIDRNEIYTLSAVAITMGFSLSSTNRTVAIGSSLVPAALVTLAYLRYRGIAKMCGTITEFLIAREKDNPSINWSTHQRTTSAGTELRISRKRLWWGLTIGCFAFIVFQIGTVDSDWRAQKQHPAAQAPKAQTK
jgi:hypothetical protein